MKLSRFLCLLLSLLVMAGCVPAPASSQTGTVVVFINVGKGDAALLLDSGSAWLIDVGPKSAAGQVQQVLSLCGISHLDGIILSHTDKDHCGALKPLLKSGITADVICYGEFYALDEGDKHPAISATEKYQIPQNVLKLGDEINLSAESKLTVLAPAALDPEEENNNSLVLRLQTPDFSVLFTGDMEKDEEFELLQRNTLLQTDVLKTAHHGKDDSTTAAFLRKIAPTAAIISTSTDDDENTASDDVICRLRNAGAAVYLTQDTSLGYSIAWENGRLTVSPLRPDES